LTALINTDRQEIFRQFVDAEGLLFMNQWLAFERKPKDRKPDAFLLKLILMVLQRIPMTMDALRTSGIGKTVNKLKRDSQDSDFEQDVLDRAAHLYQAWSNFATSQPQQAGGTPGTVVAGEMKNQKRDRDPASRTAVQFKRPKVDQIRGLSDDDMFTRQIAKDALRPIRKRTPEPVARQGQMANRLNILSADDIKKIKEKRRLGLEVDADLPDAAKGEAVMADAEHRREQEKQQKQRERQREIREMEMQKEEREREKKAKPPLWSMERMAEINASKPEQSRRPQKIKWMDLDCKGRLVADERKYKPFEEEWKVKHTKTQSFEDAEKREHLEDQNAFKQGAELSSIADVEEISKEEMLQKSRDMTETIAWHEPEPVEIPSEVLEQQHPVDSNEKSVRAEAKQNAVRATAEILATHDSPLEPDDPEEDWDDDSTPVIPSHEVDEDLQANGAEDSDTVGDPTQLLQLLQGLQQNSTSDESETASRERNAQNKGGKGMLDLLSSKGLKGGKGAGMKGAGDSALGKGKGMMGKGDILRAKGKGMKGGSSDSQTQDVLQTLLGLLGGGGSQATSSQSQQPGSWGAKGAAKGGASSYGYNAKGSYLGSKGDGKGGRGAAGNGAGAADANTSWNYKTKPCHNYHKTGRCAHGSRCVYYHDEADRRKPNMHGKGSYAGKGASGAVDGGKGSSYGGKGLADADAIGLGLQGLLSASPASSAPSQAQASSSAAADFMAQLSGLLAQTDQN